MKSANILVTFILFSAAAFPATIYVPDHYTEIQGAIDASANGDTIIVRSGTYVENIDFVGKAITVMSELGPSATVIDGGSPTNPDWGSVVYFKSGEGPDSVLEGFTISNGSGTYSSNGSLGGGVFIDWTSPTIRGNWIQGNTAAHGGGIYIYSSASVVEDNKISGNTTISGAGGGIAIFKDSQCNVTGNMICNNTSSNSSGGIFASDSWPVIKNNTISGNTASFAGGLQCSFGGATVLDNSIVDNTADTFGGGLYFYESISQVSGNLIEGNSCDTGGGGIWSTVNDSSTITCNIIRDNGVLTSGWGGGGIGIFEALLTFVWVEITVFSTLATV